ncbi:MAG TPA: hypothetical protein VJV04_09325 [Nitrospiraceae bacterium]|nr:hypothetical protein [Nitrospiraceae bacterium]
MKLLLAMLMLVTAFAAAEVSSGEELLYKCEDGTFTNIAERLCAPYESKGVVLVAPAGATFASVSAFLGEPVHSTKLPDPQAVCNLYQEWIALNMQTGGGVTFHLTQEVPRWRTLSRIFTAIGTPHCP